jgi:integrase
LTLSYVTQSGTLNDLVHTMNTVNAVSKSEVDVIHSLLGNKFGQIYSDIWKVGVNLSLRIGDLLSLQFSDIDLDNRIINLVESKTGKQKSIRLNATAASIIDRRKRLYPHDTWLFQVHSNRAKNKPISRVSVSRAFKEAGDMVKLSVNTHSMRKSRGKALFDAGVPIEKIAKVLNHSETGVTLRYLGITREDVLRTYDDFEL